MKRYQKYIAVVVLCLTVLSGCSLPGLKNASAPDEVQITALATSESQ
ncbi:osmoprotectant ABC transporter substrate-binding protein, partial [Staphylococcus equorum]